MVQFFLLIIISSSKQYDFIKRRSPVLSLLEILDDWTEMLEHGGQRGVIYFDFERALKGTLT